MDHRHTIVLPSKGDTVRILYDFSGQNDPKKLTLKAGDRVKFLGLGQAGWARGEAGGKVGFFPFAFCSVSDAAESSHRDPGDLLAEVLAQVEQEEKDDEMARAPVASGEAEATRLAPTASFVVETKTVVRTPPPSSSSAAETSVFEAAEKNVKNLSPPLKRLPEPDPRRSEVVAYATSMLPVPDPLAGVMSELKVRKKNWKMGVARRGAAAAATSAISSAATPPSSAVTSVRINSLEMRIRQLEQENRLLRLSLCAVCGDVAMVCPQCESRKNKPLPVPRDSMDERKAEEEMTTDEMSAADEPTPLGKPLPEPRESGVAPDTRESIWFFPEK